MGNEKIAFVGLPCQIQAIRKAQTHRVFPKEIEWPNKIKLTIGLFCKEVFSYLSLKQMAKKFNFRIEDATKINIEEDLIWFYMRDGSVVKIPLSEVRLFVRDNCAVCDDYSAELADISVGSTGSPTGWNTVLLRSNAGKELFKKAEDAKEIDVSDEVKLKTFERLSSKKKKLATLEIEKRESIVRPVYFVRERDLKEEGVLDFKDLESDVISGGLCTYCGTCSAVCPENIVVIEDRMPVLKGKCPENCLICYEVCPRTSLDKKRIERQIFGSTSNGPLGYYQRAISARSTNPNIKRVAQRGGVVTGLLAYALKNDIIDSALVVGKDEKMSWKPKPKIVTTLNDLLSAAGSKYAASPSITVLKVG